MVESGKLVSISYNGYIDDKLFDTTNEEMAKENNIYNPSMVYGPVVVSVGSKMLVPGLDAALLEMEEGEEKELELQPEQAFGVRDKSKVKIVSMKEFKKHNVQPIKGMPITIDNQVGKVASVNGGRVLVDFNHELAGKVVKYNLKVEKLIEEPEEIIKELIKLYAQKINTDDIAIKLTKKTATITLPESASFLQNLQMIKMAVANEAMARINGMEKVSFVDVFEKKKAKAAKSENNE
ncbi:peptidylprolyl isomerase FKBP-type [Methanococcus aeolicus Nankai-3]|uniref:peptidylprolyl isomerase n=1 Tax=Methanococcus aeolicus (strain ATCC BAA-1280 / DSM 17508 / OCM 812 / Nankai-3) TaxID=419665 RepID=A6UX29_META3|nr:FKBP-type peptidyl-prolyl cis-trans isomerase [Methanococcus aeolicus]ABR57051.1 peptidylprolyl isomerase FKBP-type [Methanococcus aeolicus Nankai-3]